MKYEVLLTAGAEKDLEALYDYVAEYDSPASADRLLVQLLKISESLSYFPERGAYPRELSIIGMREYRQLFFKPYRVIYRVMGERVFVYLIVDGRRDMQALLSRRLLAGE